MFRNTEMNNRCRLTAWLVGIGPALGIVALTGGCQLWTSPYQDVLGQRPAPSTASVAGIVSAETSPSLRSRQYDVVESSAVSGAVTHGPLYFEDSHEDDRTDADGFALTGEDFLRPTYWQARFVLNTLLFPLHAVITPPWTVMVSDGHPSRRVWGWQQDSIELREEPNGATP